MSPPPGGVMRVRVTAVSGSKAYNCCDKLPSQLNKYVTRRLSGLKASEAGTAVPGKG
ncbi:MAG: hypothetical protein IPM76_12440 [Chloroflexi bacterium]|nr:hypothetical protein [Chloroflexota bacterium]